MPCPAHGVLALALQPDDRLVSARGRAQNALESPAPRRAQPVRLPPGGGLQRPVARQKRPVRPGRHGAERGPLEHAQGGHSGPSLYTPDQARLTGAFSQSPSPARWRTRRTCATCSSGIHFLREHTTGRSAVLAVLAAQHAAPAVRRAGAFPQHVRQRNAAAAAPGGPRRQARLSLADPQLSPPGPAGRRSSSGRFRPPTWG